MGFFGSLDVQGIDKLARLGLFWGWRWEVD